MYNMINYIFSCYKRLPQIFKGQNLKDTNMSYLIYLHLLYYIYLIYIKQAMVQKVRKSRNIIDAQRPSINNVNSKRESLPFRC